jgi:hypothetical protein
MTFRSARVVFITGPIGYTSAEARGQRMSTARLSTIETVREPPWMGMFVQAGRLRD